MFEGDFGGFVVASVDVRILVVCVTCFLHVILELPAAAAGKKTRLQCSLLGKTVV